ncbi:hypothetical protein COE80_25660 [Bacillus pseudomycoides]|uniref:hypothetical protein n=1 Tax=Bacillus pseudomycoides TaxID=64104 RepID=UPI0001A15268|nr:hypothetical protein [Bacillus pseudomycoides]EEM02194.1 hypothetical protein bmyco0002_54740 [Bacillus pseudomycoides]PEJ21562.1 hypothetical protein CN887_24995 [Bacillus pseudomycoides]PGC40840.1 hypothetical protein COM18_13630 [Bacillus pseudomycoides]PHB18324.1 hypothetical protein COE80_25660 [Bacillus pseudomycoides]
MAQVLKEFYSPSKQYKVEIVKRKDGLYTTEVYRWMEDCGYEFWSSINQGMSLIDSEEHARKIAIEQLKGCSRENINTNVLKD